MNIARSLGLLAAVAALAGAAPALADLNAGFEAWNRGDYTAAVREWRDLAAAGNADAQYNMAQAYRQGKGVPKNEKQAEILLAKAAAQGHVKATDNYGLMLFQSGRREEAMPYVMAASKRGAPWAQYLIGIGHFNGDLVEKDWVRAYALMTLSGSAGYQHAAPALKQMDDFIPLEQRQQAQVLAGKLKQQAQTTLATQLASEDLSVRGGAATPSAVAPRQVAATTTARAPLPSARNRIPQPIERAVVPPSVAAAQAAVAEAERVTGTESPADAGADYARSGAGTVSPAQRRPVRVAAAQPARPAPSTATSAPAPRQPRAANTNVGTDGPWRVQLGAFSVRSNADRLWTRLASNSALSGKKKFVVPAGNIVRLQVGGYASRSAAQSACNSLKRGGQNCLVTR